MHKSYYFHQDGALGHRSKTVQSWLDKQFGGKFVKKDKWSPRWPDLNPCEFFLWGYLKDRVYEKRLDSIDKLKEEIKIEISKTSKITISVGVENMNKRCNKSLECVAKLVE